MSTYWLVDTVRHQLKANNTTSSWSEIVRMANTQKVFATAATNTYDKTTTVRKCSEPTEKIKAIYDILHTGYKPFRNLKSVVHE